MACGNGAIIEEIGGRLPARRHRHTETYTVYMARPKTDSAVLTIRVPASLDRRLAREARRRRQTRSQVARAVLEAALGGGETDLPAEARRQSLLVRRRRSEREALRFILDVADGSGGR